ncbi:MAG: helix-turn-helix domain-containing protein [Oscillospiraceae bacterium]|nr:helix-turn-helix domain-containing protein [Oscillospiraceae bacterium]
MKQKQYQDAFIGRNIKEARIAAGLTQEQLAAKLQVSGCDMTRGTLSKIEVGLRHAYAYEIKIFKQVLKIDYDFLFSE